MTPPYLTSEQKTYKLTYPSHKPTFCLKREVSVNVGLGEG